MAQHDVFIATECAAPVVRAVIEAAFGTPFQPSQDEKPVPALAVGTTKVFFHDRHPFEDDVDFPVTRYRYWINVEDSARDEGRQLAVARRVFDAARAEGWSALLSFDLQGNLAVYPETT